MANLFSPSGFVKRDEFVEILKEIREIRREHGVRFEAMDRRLEVLQKEMDRRFEAVRKQIVERFKESDCRTDLTKTLLVFLQADIAEIIGEHSKSAEDAAHKLLKMVLEAEGIETARNEHIQVTDEKGSIFSTRYTTEIDIYHKGKQMLVIEYAVRTHRECLMHLYMVVRLLREQYKINPNRVVMVTHPIVVGTFSNYRSAIGIDYYAGHFYVAGSQGGGLSILRYSVDPYPPAITDVQYAPESPNDSDVITVTASVQDGTGVASVELHYRTSEADNWTIIEMAGDSGTYSVQIGPFEAGTVVEFYITAIDTSSNGNEGTENNGGEYYRFTVISSDVTGPTISNVKYSPSSPTDSDTIVIMADVTDDSNVESVSFHFRVDGGLWAVMEMELYSGSTYRTEIGPFAEGSHVEFYISAIDGSYNANEAVNDNGGAYYALTIQSATVTPTTSTTTTTTTTTTQTTGTTSTTTSTQPTPTSSGVLSTGDMLLAAGVVGILVVVVLVDTRRR